MLDRRRFLRAGLAGVAVALGGCADRPTGPATEPEPDGTTAARDATPPPDGDVAPIGLETVAEGFASPVGYEASPVEAGLGYVVDQPGVIYVVDDAGRADRPFLDVRDRVATGGNEMGLLGLALHPDFADNGRCFVRYSAPSRPGTPPTYNHTFVLAEFRADADGRRADTGSERTVLEIPEPQSNHNAGAIAFGPDGALYVAVGDGGGANDRGVGHVDDWYDGVAGGNGQDVTENLLGSLLRIDVDGSTGERAYAIPGDNPLVGREGLDEHYAWGLRNPWRMSFAGNELFVADVGQNRYEEIDLVERGGNYGWNVREGAHCFRRGECPIVSSDGQRLRDPIVEYSHDADVGPSGIAVIGGYLYEGEAFPGLRDRYVFGDWRAEGRFFTATRPDDGRAWATAVHRVVDPDADKLRSLLSFGRDPDGELLAMTVRPRALGRSGGLHRIVPR